MLQHKLGQGLAALTDASSPNPGANLLNVVVLVTLTRMSIENYWIPNVLHDDGRDLLAAYQQSETEVWELAGRVFTPQQITELHAAIADIVANNAKAYYTGFIRFTDFTEKSSGPSKKQSPKIYSDLIGILNVGPLSHLDPATQEAQYPNALGKNSVYRPEGAGVNEYPDRGSDGPSSQRSASPANHRNVGGICPGG